jgi:hypothetical protein
VAACGSLWARGSLGALGAAAVQLFWPRCSRQRLDYIPPLRGSYLRQQPPQAIGHRPRRCYNFLLYYPAQPSMELCLTLQGLPLGGCSTMQRLSKLGTFDRRINQTLLAEMIGTGELFPQQDKLAFTPYAGPAKCSKGDSSGSSSSGGSVSTILYAPAPGGGNVTVQGTGARNGAAAAGGALLLLHAALLALAALLL